MNKPATILSQRLSLSFARSRVFGVVLHSPDLDQAPLFTSTLDLIKNRFTFTL